MSTESKRNVLLDSYNSNLAQIDKNAEKQKQAARREYDKLLKYLPEYNKANGITGGVSLSSMMRAQSDHAQKVADIDAQTSAQKNAAKQDYNQRLLDSYADNYQLANDTVTNWNGSSAELDKYVKELDGSMSQEQYNNILNMYKNAREIVVEDEKHKSLYIGESRQADDLKNDFEAGENFSVSLGGNRYKVEVGGEATGADSSIILQKATDANIGDKDVFYYNGKIYLKYGNKLYHVKERKHGNDLNALTDYLKIDSLEK